MGDQVRRELWSMLDDIDGNGTIIADACEKALWVLGGLEEEIRDLSAFHRHSYGIQIGLLQDLVCRIHEKHGKMSELVAKAQGLCR